MSVTNGNDSGPGSLRDVLAAAAPGSTIEISPVFSGIISLSSVLVIDKSITIISSIPRVITYGSIAGFPNECVIDCTANAVVTFSGIVFRGVPNFPEMGAIRVRGLPNDATSLTLNNCTIQDWNITNSKQDSTAVISVLQAHFYLIDSVYQLNTNNKPALRPGSAITCITNNSGTAIREWQIINSRFLNNVSSTVGCLAFGNSDATATANILVTGCTFSNNTETNQSIWIVVGNSTGTLRIADCTSESGSFAINIDGLAQNSAVTDPIMIESLTCRNNTASAFASVHLQHNLANRGLIIRNSLMDSNNRLPIAVRLVTPLTLTARASVYINNCTMTNCFGQTVDPGAIRVDANWLDVQITNCTVIGCRGESGAIGSGDTSVSALASVITVRNSTIVDNTGLIGGAIEIANNLVFIMYNTLVANNFALGTLARNDVLGNVNSASANNLVSVDTDMTGIFDTYQDNQVGTATNPIDPVVGTLGNYGGANGVPVVPLLAGSPAIDAGDNLYVTEAYDERGAPFVRIWSETGPPVVDIGAFEFQPFVIPCYLGSSIIKVREIQTGDTKHVQAKDVYAHKHEVYDMINNCFIPVKHNAVMQGADAIYRIPKDLFDVNKPSEDLFITSGHPIHLNGKAVKARNVPGSELMKIIRSNVYSIVTDKWVPIDVNGIGVYAWSTRKWYDRVRQEGIVWIDN